MSDEPIPEKPAPEQTSVSRRDFLRRAGSEAVKTTAQASPMNLARAAVGLSTKTPWWKRVAEWRKERTDEEKPENPNPEPKENTNPDA